MSKITKYNSNTRSFIIKELGNGSSRVSVANQLGISIHTLNRWCSIYKLQQYIDKERSNSISEAIEQGLLELSKGYETTEVTKEYIKKEIDPDTNEDIEIKYKVKKYRVSPNMKAIQVLANKYNKDFGNKESKEFNFNILNVDSDSMSLRELQELSNPIETYEVDYKELTDDGNVLESLGYEEVSSCNDDEVIEIDADDLVSSDLDTPLEEIE